jgi:hypothetical protein
MNMAFYLDPIAAAGTAFALVVMDASFTTGTLLSRNAGLVTIPITSDENR